MKKILSVLLVLVLAVGTTFAGVTLSGSASTEFAYNIEENTLGFAPSTELTVELDAVTTEKVNEGGVYAGIKATLALNGFTKTTEGVEDPTADLISVNKDDTKINEAYIAGENWKVSILSADGIPTFATGWELDSDDNAADLAV
ncbi:MAG TPA: hypothetical protein IAB12_00410, partial [Candidatus Ornithospirochaeta avicola]|nr:hypothetical protein [Candidatus Ornithospirochaeta avicola]